LKCGTRWASGALKNTLNEDVFASSDEDWLKHPQYYHRPCQKLKKISVLCMCQINQQKKKNSHKLTYKCQIIILCMCRINN
jgi:hypothetical protein